MTRVVLPFSHGVTDESTFNYTKSIIDSEETLLFSGKFCLFCYVTIVLLHVYIILELQLYNIRM